jgi:hypothetical protein
MLSDGQGKAFTADVIANTYRPDREGAIVYHPSQILHPRDAYGSLVTAAVGLRLTELSGEPGPLSAISLLPLAALVQSPLLIKQMLWCSCINRW